MKPALWIALFTFFAFLALANPGSANGGTMVSLLLVGILVYTVPTLGGEGRS